jgi:hypothetical protein
MEHGTTWGRAAALALALSIAPFSFARTASAQELVQEITPHPDSHHKFFAEELAIDGDTAVMGDFNYMMEGNCGGGTARPGRRRRPSLRAKVVSALRSRSKIRTWSSVLRGRAAFTATSESPIGDSPGGLGPARSSARRARSARAPTWWVAR